MIMFSSCKHRDVDYDPGATQAPSGPAPFAQGASATPAATTVGGWAQGQQPAMLQIGGGSVPYFIPPSVKTGPALSVSQG